MDSGANTESLEERLERIRLRNEEIEKKHREAEEDRIRALKDNALVELRTNEQDWPKAHKYDTLDFTYDVDPAKLQDTSVESTAQTEAVAARRKKTFSEKDAPPPDPAYNFLADSERDGTDPMAKKDLGFRNQSNNKSSGSFRRQNSSTTTGNAGGGTNPAAAAANKDKGKRAVDGNEFRKPIQFEIQPKKNLETNWRERDDTNSSTPTAVPPAKAAAPSTPDTPHSNEPVPYQQKKPLPLTAPPTNHSQPLPSHIQRPPALRGGMMNSASTAAVQQNIAAAAPTVVRQPLPMKQPTEPVVPEQLVVEQRGNIQISVKDGEIQSVKLTNPGRTTPGTGRVGIPRAITKQSQPPPAPAEIATSHGSPQILPPEAKNPNYFRIPNMAYPPPPVTVQAVSAPPPLRVTASTPAVALPPHITDAAVASQDPPKKKFSVQDRLRIVPT